ncbi:MAG TPA: alpha/beta fold hydrolase [Candidatus Nanoarchaeia archaeon]|nr:alpha/beta fold hydrolase [Candidatus Nanoarchaeia archaeon]
MHRFKAPVLGVLVVAASVVTVWKVPKAALIGNTTSSTEQSFDQQLLNPLTIQAIRARQYPGSDIVTEQQLGQRVSRVVSIVSYQSDGLKIYAQLSLPTSDKPAAGYPVIILDHGYINPAQYQTDGPEYASWIDALTGAGFAVIKPDYRGNGNSEGVPEGGHYSPVYAYDNLNLVTSLKNFAPVDSKRIGLLGHSLGGHEALRTIVVSPDIKATSLAAGVTGSFYDLFYNWPHSPAPNDQPTTIVRGNLERLLSEQGDPKSNPDFWASASSVNYVSAVTGAVQVNHGTADVTVPKLFSDHLVEALQKAGKSVEYQVYPGGDHQFSHDHQLFLQRLIDFYNRNL